MSRKCEWKVTGVISHITDTCGKYSNPYWKIALDIDESQVTLFVHNEYLFSTVTILRIGDTVEACGVIVPRAGEAHKPQILNPSEIKILVRS